MPPLISIITPVRNGADWISKCISTVATLSVSFEHIIVDGYSSDGTEAVVRALSNDCIVIKETRPGAGMYAAIADGINVSRAKYIAYLNCDDRYLSDSLAKAICYADTNNIDLLVCAGVIDDQDLQSYSLISVPISPSYFLRNGVIPTTQPSIIFSRRAYDRNPLDTSLRIVGDLDLFARIALDTGCRIGSFSEPVSIFTKHRASLGANNLVHQRLEMTRFKHHSLFSRLYLKLLRMFAFILA